MSSIITDNFMKFGDALQWLLDQREMSQADFSEKVGISDSTINKYISGALNPPRKRRVKKFERILGGEIKKQPNGSWTAKMDKKVKEAVTSMGQLEEKASAYKAGEQPLDEISRDLEFAQRLISDSLKKIDSLKDDI